MCRTILLTLAVLALVAVAPTFAAPAPAAPPQPAAAVAAPQGACAPSLDLLAPSTEAVCKQAALSTTVPQPEFMTSTVTYKGYCHCGCRFVKDCNTDADCGGGRCLGGVSCC
jgi:hypothetical protein